MAARSRALAAHVSHDQAGAEHSPEVKARLAQAAADIKRAEATRQMAAAVRDFTKRVGPAADTIHGLGERLDKLCAFLRRWFWPLMCSVPLVLSFINGLSPSMAEGIANFFAFVAKAASAFNGAEP